jgi:Cu-Zn family superoxide dismutase
MNLKRFLARYWITVLAVVTLLSLAVAGRASAGDGGALRASATLRDAQGNAVGVAYLVEDVAGVLHLNIHAKGLTPGPHGVHLHAAGVCDGSTSVPFSSALGHHNPTGHQHGLDNPAGSHAGDLPNLDVNAEGVGHLNGTTTRATLSPGAVTLFDANGSAIVIHAGPDDQLTDPAGNSGPRIACGVLQSE